MPKIIPRLEEFCAFILTHGRPDKVHTRRTLKRCGYTGRIILLVDDQDRTLPDYIREYGDEVVVFSKEEIAKTFDEGDNFDDRRTIVYARNACFGIAKRLGFKYFIQLDDDYTDFRYKFNARGQYGDWYIKNLDAIFTLLLGYYKSIPALSIAIAQGGDFIGGENGSNAMKIGVKRKCMNTFICSTDRPFQFIGRINEDVNTYTAKARTGALFLTITSLAINQITTQKSGGGMTDIYVDKGTYVKTFYSVMFAPSCVKVAEVGSKFRRIHHRVTWDHACPVIIDERHRKTPR